MDSLITQFYSYFKPNKNPRQQSLIDAIHAYCQKKQDPYIRPLATGNLVCGMLAVLCNKQNNVDLLKLTDSLIREVASYKILPKFILEAMESVPNTILLLAAPSYLASSSGSQIYWSNWLLGGNLGFACILTGYKIYRDFNHLDQVELIREFSAFKDNPEYQTIISCENLYQLKNVAGYLQGSNVIHTPQVTH